MPRKLDDFAYDPNPTATEDSAERGFVKYRKDAHDPETYRDLGKSDEVDDDNAGDIADEGRGHRG
jgi:hypothetical protein